MKQFIVNTLIDIKSKFYDFFTSTEQLEKRRWQDIEYFNEDWKLRIKNLHLLSPKLDGKIIMDLGCGKMWLKELLDSSSVYIPVDYVYRGPKTVVCDFNKGEFPSIRCDISFVSGCLEYIDDPSWFIKEICLKSDICLISYCPVEHYPTSKERIAKAWKNALSIPEVMELFLENNFELIEMKKGRNTLFRFDKLDDLE